MDVLLCTASIWHMCTMSLDRYCTLRYPISYGRSRTRTSVALKIAFVWVVSTAVCMALAVTGFADYSNVYVDRQCVPAVKEFILYGSVLAFYVPLVIMIVTYALTMRILKENRRAMKSIGLHALSGKQKFTARTWKADVETNVEQRAGDGRASTGQSRCRSTFAECVSSGMVNSELLGGCRGTDAKSQALQSAFNQTIDSDDGMIEGISVHDDRRQTPPASAANSVCRRLATLPVINQLAASSRQSKTDHINTDDIRQNCSLCVSSPSTHTRPYNSSARRHGPACRCYWQTIFQLHSRNRSPSLRDTALNTSPVFPLIENGQTCRRRLSDGALLHTAPTSGGKLNSPVNRGYRWSPRRRCRKQTFHIDLDAESENLGATATLLDLDNPQSQVTCPGNSWRSLECDADICRPDRVPTLSDDASLLLEANGLGLARLYPYSVKPKRCKFQRDKAAGGDGCNAEFDRLPDGAKNTSSTRDGADRILKRVGDNKSTGRGSEPGVDRISADHRRRSWSYCEPYIIAADGSLTLSSASPTTTDRVHKSSLSIALRPRSRNAYRLSSTGHFHSTAAAFSRRRSIATNERKASKVLGIIFAVFVVLWTPFFVVNVLSVVCESCLDALGPAAMSSLVWLGYASSLANPIVYTMFSTSFRTVFCRIITCRPCRGNDPSSRWTYSRASYQLARQTTVADPINSGRPAQETATAKSN